MLDKDINLRKLWQRGELKNARKYLDRLLDNYKIIQEKYGECNLHIGTMGDGSYPNYVFRVKTNHDDRMEWVHATAQNATFYSGRTHEEIPFLNVRDDENWSYRMTYMEVIMLFNDLRQSEKVAKKRR